MLGAARVQGRMAEGDPAIATLVQGGKDQRAKINIGSESFSSMAKST